MTEAWWAAVIVGAAISIGCYAASMLPQLPQPYPQYLLAICVLTIVITLIVAAWGVRRKRHDPEISTAEAVHWIADHSRWGRRVMREQQDGLELLTVARAFELAAREGRITIRGRRRGYTDVETLPSGYWETAGLDLTRHLFDDQPDCRTELRRNVSGYVEYEALRVSARAVRGYWPAPLLERLFPWRLRIERHPA
jgi:hypothetical protein